MRARLLVLIPLAFVAAASAQQGSIPPELARSQAEFEAAQSEAARLQRVAASVSDELARLRAEQRASAAEIEATEARITLAELRLRKARADVRARRLALAQAQRPVAALLAGVATMGDRPPLLAMLDRSSIDSFVETRILLDSTLPFIRSRSSAYAEGLAAAERDLVSARTAQAELKASHGALSDAQRRFASIEQRLLDRSLRTGGAAVEASDRVLAAEEASERALGDYRGSSAMRAIAHALASGAAIPPRPGSSGGSWPMAPFAYRLPANAPVTQGMGDVDSAGIRARGVTIATARGEPLEVPGAGTVRFAGPFRGIDGVLVIDHGGGWMTMLVNVSTELRRGQRVAIGDPAGRALGPISVELYRNGKPYSPALIAGSSPALSKGREGG